MSYVPRPRYAGLGSVTSVINAAAAVVQDPCLNDVADLVLRLHAAEVRAAGPTAMAGDVPPPAVGIGLCYAVTPLKIAAFASENRWVLPIGILATVGTIFLAGMAFGGKR